MDLQVKIQDLDKLITAFVRSEITIRENMRLALKQSMVDIKETARKNHRFTSRSHNLERSISQEIVKDWPLSGQVFLDQGIAPYGPFLHAGTGKFGPRRQVYSIEPKKKKALRWPGKGTFIFAKRVIHPGIKSDPFLYQAAQVNRENINAIFNRYAQKAIKEAGL